MDDSEDVSSKVPDKFSAKDLPIFQPMDDPRFHLKGFRAITSLKGIEVSLLPKVFPLSLDPVCQKWFYSLSDKETTTWEDVAHAFMTRYRSNTQDTTSQRELEILKQEEKEGFTTFLTRWKTTAARMVTPPTEGDMVSIFIENLRPIYRNRLRYLGLESFDKVYRIGIQIENDIIKEGSKNKGSSNEPCIALSIHNLEASSSSKPVFPRPRREYTPLGMTYDQAFERLNSRGLISPLGPTPDPPMEKRGKFWNSNKFCKYHRGNGHSTERCWTLKNLIQDMVEDGRIPVPPGGRKPTTQTH